ncbi:MAG: energy-coupling factor transporter transmembrane protein EcfT [SAR324 cluster bacterium]|nr:energy-coupling factor transporter transmembrane protein EcfT [SAR324 cluster bacterium]
MKALSSRAAMALALQFTLVTLLVDRPLNLGILTGLAALVWLTGRRGRHWVPVTLILILSTWSVMLTQGLFYGGFPRTALIRLLPGSVFPLGDPPGLYLYGEGLLHGLLQSLRFDVMILLGAGLLARYGNDELVEGLRGFRLPATLCFLFSLALRFLPLMVEELRTAWTAQRLRGFRPFGPGAGGAWRRSGTVARVILFPLFASNLRKSDEIAAALLSRGFAPEEAGPIQPLGRGEALLCWAGLLAVVGLAAALVLTALHVRGMFTLEGLAALYRWVTLYV